VHFQAVHPRRETQYSEAATVTRVARVPEKHVDFALFPNSEGPGVLSSMQYRLLDH
jgi:hypothetical protein